MQLVPGMIILFDDLLRIYIHMIQECINLLLMGLGRF